MMLVPESHDAVALHDAMSVGFCQKMMLFITNLLCVVIREVHFNLLVYMLPRKWPLFATLETLRGLVPKCVPQ